MTLAFMVTYPDPRGDRRRFLALTGLTVPEFDYLPAAFARSYERRYPAGRTAAGRPRQRRAGGGRTAVLHGPARKLLFLLVYPKTYPLQVVMAELFGLSPPQANHWLGRLLPALRDALDDPGARPQRDGGAFAGAGPGARLIIGGTERRRQRPKNPEKQAAHYSGRKKVHCDRNVVAAEAGSRRVGFLSRAHPGRSSDKGIADREAIASPPGAVLHQGGGFRGYAPAGVKTRRAKKEPAGGELTAAAKGANRKLRRIRVRVGHALAGVKRCRIVKDALRNTADGASDSVMEVACGLHNVRVRKRQRRPGT